MSCKIIDGKSIAAEIRKEIAGRVSDLKERTGLVTGLATVLVGDDPASKAYVGMKHKACGEAGMHSEQVTLPENATQQQVEAEIARLAADDKIHGILVQLPLPAHLDEDRIISLIPLEKDVDGFHPVNMGLLVRRGCEPHFVPCTPAGCIELLVRSGVELSGARAVVVGRSNIVGLPVAMLLQEQNATVTILHSRTRDMAVHLKEADVVVVAIGKPNFVTGEMLKPGAAVIDVGINKVDDSSRPRGYRLVGDVEFESAKEVAGWLTPVPGGVGPMTIAMLLHNTLKGAEARAAEMVAR